MKPFLKKIIKSLIIGSIIFLAINYIDGKNFYDYHDITRSYLIGFYFYPLLVIADLINLIISISDNLIYKILLNPLYFSFDQVNYGHAISKRIGTLILGILWTSSLTYIYFSITVFKKLPTVLKIILYISAILLVTYIASVISVETFGNPYVRLCKGCA